MTADPSILSRRRLPWRVRWQLRRLGAYRRAVAETSGAKEWSDRELERLRPSWIRRLLGRYMAQCAVLAFLYLLALLFLGASVERYWHWLQSVEAVAGEPVRTVDRWTAHCRVKPWTNACRPAPQAEIRKVTFRDRAGNGSHAPSGPLAEPGPSTVLRTAGAST